jgi:predicted membrane-bound mannosyltransferase
VERTSEHRNVRTWYAEASPVAQHVVMLLAASLIVLVLIAIAVVVHGVFGVSADGAL